MWVGKLGRCAKLVKYVGTCRVRPALLQDAIRQEEAKQTQSKPSKSWRLRKKAFRSGGARQKYSQTPTLVG